MSAILLNQYLWTKEAHFSRGNVITETFNGYRITLLILEIPTYNTFTSDRIS